MLGGGGGVCLVQSAMNTRHSMPSSLSAIIAGVSPHAFKGGGGGGGVNTMHNMPSLLSASVACTHALGGGGGGSEHKAQYA